MKFKSVKDFETDEEFVKYYDSLSKQDQIKFLISEFELMVLENEKFNPSIDTAQLVLLCMDAFITQSIMVSMGYEQNRMTQLLKNINADILDKEDKEDEPTWN